MSIEKVRAFFRARGIEERVREFTVSSATVELAAAALGCAPERIAKTLSFGLDGRIILVVAAALLRLPPAGLSHTVHYQNSWGALHNPSLLPP